MEIQIGAQLAQTALGVLLGAVLGLYYDILRLPRLLSGTFGAVLTDILFWLGALFCLFCFGLGAGGGQLRLFMFLSAGLGFVLWRVGPGVLIRSGEAGAAAFLKQSAQKRAARRKQGRTHSKKVLKFLKNLFPSSARWFTISGNKEISAAGVIHGRRSRNSAANRGDSDEI